MTQQMSQPDDVQDQEWASVSLRVFSKDLSAAALCEALGAPTLRFEKGQQTGRGKIPRDESGWILESPGTAGAKLEEKLGWMLDFLESRIENVRGLEGRCQVDLFCGFSSGSGQGAFLLDRVLLARLHRVSLNLTVDLYPPEKSAVESVCG